MKNKIFLVLFCMAFFNLKSYSNTEKFNDIVSIKLVNGRTIEPTLNVSQITSEGIILLDQSEININQIKEIKFFYKDGSLKTLKLSPVKFSGGDSSGG